MILPLGTLILMVDGALNASMNAGVQITSAYVSGPVVGLTALSYVAQGLKVANGDPRPFQQFWPNLIRTLVIIWLVTRPDVYNYWVRGLLYIGIPDSFINAIATGMGAQAVQIGGGATGTAAIFDRIWAQINVVVGVVWDHASVWDVGAYLAGYASLATCGLALLFNAIVYIGANFILGIMMILGPAALSLGVPESTREFAVRWSGKCASLIIVKVVSVFVLQILLTGDRSFMDAIAKPIPASDTSVLLVDQVQGLVGMVIWFCAGAFAMLSVTAVSYSIGTGIAVSATDMFAGYFLMRGMAGLAKSGLDALGKIPAYPSRNTLNVSLARPEIGAQQTPMIGRSPAALPPPPPPPLIARQ